MTRVRSVDNHFLVRAPLALFGGILMARIYVLIRRLITGTPQLLFLHSLVAIMLGFCFGALFLWMPGNTWGFFNPCTWIFGVYAVPFLVVALAKYAVGK